jgi:hypothetical protein
MRKEFDVVIYDKVYEVFDIKDKEHEGLNGEPKTWWIYMADKLPEGLLPPIDSENWKPYHVSIKRIVWDIVFHQTNTTKEKWNDTQFNNNIRCEIHANRKPVYSFGTFDMAFAFAKAQYLMTVICEHSYNFLNPEVEKGRKIFFYGLPALVYPSSHPGEISIHPDYAVLKKDEWWKLYKQRHTKINKPADEWDEMEAEDMAESMRDDRINWGDALSDGNIDWHRKYEGEA